MIVRFPLTRCAQLLRKFATVSHQGENRGPAIWPQALSLHSPNKFPNGRNAKLAISFEEMGLADSLLLKKRRIGMRLRKRSPHLLTLNLESPSLYPQIAKNRDAHTEHLLMPLRSFRRS